MTDFKNTHKHSESTEHTISYSTCYEKLIISRVWEMPNSRTFKIKAIRNLILKYVSKDMVILDPFANEMSIKKSIINAKYISNDLDTEYKCDFNLDAEDFLKNFDDKSIDFVLFDPPYSGRQVAECYKKLNKTVTMHDTNSGWIKKFKKEISRITKENGYVITCGWSSSGVGKKYGFEIIEILLISHGSSHNDTICVVERKLSTLFG